MYRIDIMLHFPLEVYFKYSYVQMCFFCNNYNLLSCNIIMCVKLAAANNLTQKLQRNMFPITASM